MFEYELRFSLECGSSAEVISLGDDEACLCEAAAELYETSDDSCF